MHLSSSTPKFVPEPAVIHLWIEGWGGLFCPLFIGTLLQKPQAKTSPEKKETSKQISFPNFNTLSIYIQAMASGQFQGSHAFTRGEQLYQESVNPNTGSLTIKAPLVNLTGVRSTLDFKLSLVYSAGSLGTFGLPNNWGLDLPYVCGGKSLTTGGRTYVVDLGWLDSDGHKSGLRYVNNHGIVLTKVVPPLPLPSEKRGLYGWKLRNPDGSTDYLDQAGKPRERHDMYGNHLHLTYANDLEGGPDSPRVWLRSIQDSWGQQITFGHQPGSGMSIKTPNGGEIKVVFSNATGGVTLVTNPEGLKTSFEYVDFDEGRRLVSSVKYPSGLRSRYSYTPITYLGSDGSPHAMAAVQDHYQVSMSDNTVHRHDHYAYGSGSNCTYTGAAINLRMSGRADPLMDRGPQSVNYRQVLFSFRSVYRRETHMLWADMTWSKPCRAETANLSCEFAPGTTTSTCPRKRSYWPRMSKEASQKPARSS
jgi:hypothetical protein